jgi:hypothetical protein
MVAIHILPRLAAPPVLPDGHRTDGWLAVLALHLMALALGACAGLWDLADAGLTGTVLLLLLGGLALGLIRPRLLTSGLAAIGLGVLLTHLMSPGLVGSIMPGLETGLISAAVSLVPGLLGGLVGVLIDRVLQRRFGRTD